METTTSSSRSILLRVIFIAVAICAGSRAASGQSVLPETGRRVRVFFNEGRDYFIGWMLPASTDSLFIEGSGGDTLAVARRNVVRLQIASGSRAGSTLIGMGIGLGAGAGIGFAIGRGTVLGGDVLGAIVLGGIGTVAGGVTGYKSGGHWRDVQIAPVLGARGGAVRIAVRF